MTGDKGKIPRGDYCYELTGGTVMVKYVAGENGRLVETPPYPVPERRVCPFWSLPKRGKGYCAYLEKSDDDLEVGLLWDQVKECGENTGDFDERIRCCKWHVRSFMDGITTMKTRKGE